MQRRTRLGAPGRALQLRIAIVAVTSAALVFGVAAPVSAIDWFTETLRNHAGTTLQDADFNGPSAAVVWREGGSVWLRSRSPSDDDFGPRSELAPTSRQAETEVCGDAFRVTYARNYSDTWLIDMAYGATADASVFGTTPVSPDGQQTRDPDVACTNGRVFESWLAKEETGWKLYVANALAGDLVFGSPENLAGPLAPYAGQPVMAGAGSRAHVAYTFWNGEDPGGNLYVHSYAVGAGKAYPVTALGFTRLTTYGLFPQIAAYGRRVVVVWTSKCGAIKGRVSTDRGDTWGPIRTIKNQECAEDQPSLIAEKVVIRPGDHAILVGYSKFLGGLKGPSETAHRLSVNSSDYASSSFDTLLLRQDGSAPFKVGAWGAGSDLLVGASDVGPRIQFRVQSESP